MPRPQLDLSTFTLDQLEQLRQQPGPLRTQIDIYLRGGGRGASTQQAPYFPVVPAPAVQPVASANAQQSAQLLAGQLTWASMTEDQRQAALATVQAQAAANAATETVKALRDAAQQQSVLAETAKANVQTAAQAAKSVVDTLPEAQQQQLMDAAGKVDEAVQAITDLADQARTTAVVTAQVDAALSEHQTAITSALMDAVASAMQG